MKPLRTLNQFLQYLTLFILMVVIIGSVMWITQNLPYEGNIAMAEVRDISRIEVPGGDEKLHIFDRQISCHQQDARSISCEHWLSGQLLRVDVHLQQQANRVIYDCSALYNQLAVDCNAFESVYTHGGLATPVVVISQDMSQQIPDFEQLASSYSIGSIYNLQLWLKRGIPVVVVLFAIQGLIWLWGVQDRWWPNGSRQRPARIITTVVASIPAGIFLLFGTVYLLVSLKIVS